MKRRFQRFVVYTEILPTFRVESNTFLREKYAILPFKPMGTKNQTALPFGHLDLRLIHPSLYVPTHYPKRHLDPFSRFATVHFPDRQTDRHTHRWTDVLGDRSVRLPRTLAILIESDALTTHTRSITDHTEQNNSKAKT